MQEPSLPIVDDAITTLNQAARIHLERRPDVVFRPLASAAEREMSYRLRAHTAMTRWDVPAEEFPGGLDVDADDAHALHLGGWRGDHLVATARLIPATGTELLPVERLFGVLFPNRPQTLEVGRVVITAEIVDRRQTGLLALLAACWQYAEERRYWVGPNSESITKLYRILGADPVTYGQPKLFHGETRIATSWDMYAFSQAFRRLAERNRSAA